ncbi:CBF-domain-containing protein [Violaceomyces palustris]|uniref:CBF-domain-containing protein n=1 Tax=Violaceomyces palustris TaxID=1673888 RepID=A0ACD0P3W7_9BASI|nr:CBF-domain-containing protein [Violaceomyces palustris]
MPTASSGTKRPRSASTSDQQPSSSTNNKVSKKTSSSLLERISDYQSQLASSSDLNPLSDLLQIAQKQARLSAEEVNRKEDVQESAKALHRSIHILVRSFQSLCKEDKVILSDVDQQGWTTGGEGKASLDERGEPKPEALVKRWIKSRWNQLVELLCSLLGHPLEEIRSVSLDLLFNLQISASSSLTRITEALDLASGEKRPDSPVMGKWSASPWRAIVLSLVAGPPSLEHLGGCEDYSREKVLRRQETVSQEVRQRFAEKGIEEYDDVRYAFLRELATILRIPPQGLEENKSLRPNALALMVLLTAIPTQEADLNNFLVQELSKPLPSLDGDAKKGTKKKKTKTTKGKTKGGVKPKFSEDGDSDEEGEENEDMTGWFSESEDEAGPKGSEFVKVGGGGGSSVAGLGKAAKEARRKSRRGRAPPFHEGLHLLSSQKYAFSAAWLELLLPRKELDERTGIRRTLGGELSLGLTHEILVRLHNQILPHMVKPTLLHDFLVGCIDSGGATALLALNALFTLITSHNLDYPSFYPKLYSLLDASLLHMRYRARFLRLLDIFLGSTHLSASLVASFAKRLSRLALRAPPAAIASVVPFVWNLLKRHPRCLTMIHREWDGDRLALGPAGVEDPFDPEEKDPTKTKAIESSLWELASFGANRASSDTRVQIGSTTDSSSSSSTSSGGGESHYLSSVTTLTSILAEPFTKERYALEDFLDLTYSTLFENEVKKTTAAVRRRGGEESKPSTIKPPALVHSLPDGRDGSNDANTTTNRVHIFPTLKARIKAEQVRKSIQDEEQEERRKEEEEQEVEREGEDEEEKQARLAIQQLKRSERNKNTRSDLTGSHDLCSTLFDFGP